MRAQAKSNRLPAPYGICVDRDKPISFSFEGVEVAAIVGDTIASALVADKQWLMSRSFKYHRPRGPLTMAAQDANTLVQLPSAPNTLADRHIAVQDLQVTGQNYIGSLKRDWQSIIGLFSRFLPVGFYYKAFFRPKGIWEYWAPFIRKQAGLGKIDQTYTPSSDHSEYFDKQYKFADIAIVGGGPAGLSAALEAAKAGVEVLLIEENKVLGGSLNYARFGVDRRATSALRESLISQVLASKNIEVMTDTVCNSWHPDNWLGVVAQKRLYKVRAKQVIVCSGSLEQQAIFHGNDIPGVVMSSAALRLMHLYAVKPGDDAVVLTGNDEGYATALELHDAGVRVKAIVDMREQAAASALSEAVGQHNIATLYESTVYAAKIDGANKRLKSVSVHRITARGKCAAISESIDCDLLCMSVGYMPTYQLVCQAGGALSYDDASCTFSLSKLPRDFAIAGSVNGKWSLDKVIEEGAAAGRHAVHHVLEREHEHESVEGDPLAADLNFPWPMFAHPKGKEFVDYDEDLQIKDIINATRDGYEHIQLVKRYSTCGMGPSQGRHSALAAARLVADATGRTVAETGVTTARPPFAAEQLAHNAGRSFYPARRTNMHYRHLESGAQMMLAGAWYRPAFYVGPGNRASDKNQLIQQEVANVRNNVGLVDVSTLGGIEVRGADAAEFLNRFYTFAFAKQPVGKARYALLTNEAGVIIDDGVACRFHADHFYVTATTGGVDRVFQSMLKWNTQWCLDVDIANATTAWCGVNIAGPKSRQVLAKVCSDVDLSNESFPYMGVREGTVAGIPARLIRVGFVGELGFELHVPQQYGEALWDILLEAGAEQGIQPFGIEAQRVLRLEKGHVIIGQDTDAMSNPMEVQMSWALARNKPFFVGARTLRELEAIGQGRVLVGFVIEITSSSISIPKESHLVLDGDNMVGRVTSCNYSPTLDKLIGLAYVPINKKEVNSKITIKVDGGELVTASVVALPFYDPENLRQVQQEDVGSQTFESASKLPLRRNPLNRQHQDLGAKIRFRDDGSVVINYANSKATQIEAAHQLALADITGLGRIGFKGVDTNCWLISQGLSLPASPNQACTSGDGLTMAKLSDNEIMILDQFVQPTSEIGKLREAWSLDIPEKTYLLERADSHACFALVGQLVPELLSKVCAVDMRVHKFSQHSVAQTSLARANAIVIRSDLANTPCFYVLVDLSSSEFVWQGLLDAMQEFDGQLIGLDALQDLSKPH